MDIYFVAEQIGNSGAEIIASSDILTSKNMGYGWSPTTVKALAWPCQSGCMNSLPTAW